MFEQERGVLSSSFYILDRIFKNSSVVNLRLLNAFFIINSGTGCSCVCTIIGRGKSERDHFSCPPFVLIFLHPTFSRNFR